MEVTKEEMTITKPSATFVNRENYSTGNHSRSASSVEVQLCQVPHRVGPPDQVVRRLQVHLRLKLQENKSIEELVASIMA